MRTLLLMAATLLRQRGWPAGRQVVTGSLAGSYQLSLRVQGDGAGVEQMDQLVFVYFLPGPLFFLLAWPVSFQIETVS